MSTTTTTTPGILHYMEGGSNVKTTQRDTHSDRQTLADDNTAIANKLVTLKHVVLVSHIDCPPEFVTLRFVENLLYRDAEFFTPSDGNARIQIV